MCETRDNHNTSNDSLRSNCSGYLSSQPIPSCLLKILYSNWHNAISLESSFEIDLILPT